MQYKLVKNFKNFLFREKLISQGDKFIVGISGGSDSVGLVKLLLAIRKKFDLELFLVHINYNLRGEDSEGDEKFVREFAEKEGLELEVVRYVENKNNAQYAGVNISTNLEERLRDFRYKQFEKIRREKNFDWIVLAHHQDDQIETFLINLFRGAGVEGLKGMLIKNEESRVLRPVLNFSKKDIVEFLESIGQEWREDHTNRENIFLRNKIRNILIPIIEKEYSPQFKQRVASMTVQLQDYFSLSDTIIEEAMKNVMKNKNENSVVINVKKYLKLDSGLRALVFRRIIKGLKGDLQNVSQGNYYEFEKILESEKGKRPKIKMQSLEFEKVGDKLKINLIE